MTGKNDSLLKTKLLYGPTGPFDFLFSLFTDTQKLLKVTLAIFTGPQIVSATFLMTDRQSVAQIFDF